MRLWAEWNFIIKSWIKKTSIFNDFLKSKNKQCGMKLEFIHFAINVEATKSHRLWLFIGGM